MGRHSAPQAPARRREPAVDPTAAEPSKRIGRHAGPPTDPVPAPPPARPVEPVPSPPPARPVEPVTTPPPARAVEPAADPPAAQLRQTTSKPGLGPVTEVLCWTAFAAGVAWATITAAGHDPGAAAGWAFGLAALVPFVLALLTLAARLRDRRGHRRDQ